MAGVKRGRGNLGARSRALALSHPNSLPLPFPLGSQIQPRPQGAVNKTRIGLFGSDCGSDGIGLEIRLKFEEVILLLTTSRRYRTLLISALFLNVSSEIGSVKTTPIQKRVEMEKKH